MTSNRINPNDIKVTNKSPTLDQLKEYRADWLREAEESGMINDLFKIVNTLGVRGKKVHPNWPPCNRYEFSAGNNDYVILLINEAWGTMQQNGKTIITWEMIYVVENGEHMREIEYKNKRLVKYYRRLELSPAQKAGSKANNDAAKIKENLYVPGDWELFIGTHLELANSHLAKTSTGRSNAERETLLKDLCLKTS